MYGSTGNTAEQQSLLNAEAGRETSSPAGPTPTPNQINSSDPSRNIKDELYARDYEITIGKWLGQAWRLFKACYKSLLIYSVIFWVVEICRQVAENERGGAAVFFAWLLWFVEYALMSGGFLAPFHAMRSAGQEERAIAEAWDWKKLYSGFFWFWVLFWSHFFYYLFVAIGLVLLILPGLYLLFALAWSFPLYLEFKSAGLGFFQSYRVSNHQVWKHFFGNVGLFILTLLLILLGFLCLGVGLLVAMPVVQLTIAFAFRDIFGLNYARPDEDTLIVCCF